MTSVTELESCFVETFALAPGADPRGLEFQSILEWDPVGHVRLVGAIESAFGVMLGTQDMLDLNSFARAVEILNRHGARL